MFRSKTAELMIGDFSSGGSLQDFVHGKVGPTVIGSVNGKVFSAMGQNFYQIDSLEIFSTNDPVKKCKK